MAKPETCKIRLLAVYYILLRGDRTTTRRIIRELENRFGITADRKTIYDDILAIDRFIPIESKPGRYGGYKAHDFSEVFKDA